MTDDTQRNLQTTETSTHPQPDAGEEKQTDTEQPDHFDTLLAATLVDDARAARNINYNRDSKSIRSYVLYNHWLFKAAVYVCVWFLLVITIFEKPAVIDLGQYRQVMVGFELLVVMLLISRLFHNLYFDEIKRFWSDPKNTTLFVILILFIVDICSYEIWIKVSGDPSQPIRWSRILRPLVLVNIPEGRELRKALRNIRRTIPDILPVIALFTGSIAIFALISTKLLYSRHLKYPDGSGYFENFFESFWDLYVLVTTANSPDVMLPAYDHNRWFAVLFVVYLIINLFIFISIVLAVIYNNYKRHLTNEVKLTLQLKQSKLLEAFDLVKVWQDGRYVVPAGRWYQLIRLVDTHRSAVQTELMLYVLDEHNTQSIDQRNFLRLADLLNITITEISDDVTWLESVAPNVYNSTISCYARSAALHVYFKYFFDLAIFINAICIGLNFEESEWFFVSIFSLEISLKLYALGGKQFFCCYWNIFDFTVITLAFIGLVIEAATHMNVEYTEFVDFLLVLRVLRLIRIANAFQRFKVILSTLLNIGPSIVTYGGLIFILYYMYAIVGMELFAGRITYTGYENVSDVDRMCGNALLNGTEFVERRYCSNNFNSIGEAFVVLFSLMVVDQWHVIASGFVKVTHISVRLYFLSFHILGVLLLLDLFTAFVLEVFLLEYSYGRSELESTIEKHIKDMGLSVGQTPVPRKQKAADKRPLVDEMEQVEADLPEVTVGVSTSTPIEGNCQHPPGVHEKTGLRFRINKKWKKRVEFLLEQEILREHGDEFLTTTTPTTTTTSTTHTALEPTPASSSAESAI